MPTRATATKAPPKATPAKKAPAKRPAPSTATRPIKTPRASAALAPQVGSPFSAVNTAPEATLDLGTPTVVTHSGTASTVVSLAPDPEAELAAMRAKLEEKERELAVARATMDAFSPDDRVTVLHGWGRVRPTEVTFASAISHATYRFEGGMCRGVLYSDAKFWQDKYGASFLKILPNTADVSDFARATGVQPMELRKLTAMLEAVSLQQLHEAWGVENALRWMERFAASIAQRRQAVR